MPWTTLDMSSINDPEQLTGSSRVYANAKPGIIMEAFSMAGESNLVFIINELDKAASGKGNGNPADVLLTLLDNLGFTDNYMECMVPTVGVYPIATANDKAQISAPLMSRFAVIDIPDYTEDTSDDSGQDNNENWDYIDNGDGSDSDNGGDYTEDTSDQDIEYYE